MEHLLNVTLPYHYRSDRTEHQQVYDYRPECLGTAYDCYSPRPTRRATERRRAAERRSQGSGIHSWQDLFHRADEAH